ncbi:hypothetical protein [Actinoplanes campanulatus]|uniref:hypothetical protein n=1 Tax=Actinoplanes campanulatus TaxID=113559 RepID=UPI001952DD96|nr:hypothetical protein [Actinoplanes capillaceus]
MSEAMTPSSSALIAGLWRRTMVTSRNQAQRRMSAGEFSMIIFAAGLTLPRAGAEELSYAAAPTVHQEKDFRDA